jgi:putative transposase
MGGSFHLAHLMPYTKFLTPPDNPFSESCFKTIKYQPDYLGRFHDVAHARRWFTEFFDWYANRHRHSGLALFTPADVFFGRVAQLADNRQRALDVAYETHAERFVRGGPTVRLPPAKVAINPIDPGAATQSVADALIAPDHVAPNTARVRPSPPTPVRPGTRPTSRLQSSVCS